MDTNPGIKHTSALKPMLKSKLVASDYSIVNRLTEYP